MFKVEGSPKLVRDIFQITEEQQRLLIEEAKRTGKSKAEIVREALDVHFTNTKAKG